jgi:hypothetical protein
MTTRRQFIAVSAFTASALASIKSVSAQPTPQAPGEAEFLFVQSSHAMSFDRATSKLTLIGVSPITIFFTDRPQRIAGNMKTAGFIPFWSQGKDSFKANPPNADVSLIENRTLKQVVVELQDPALSGDDLSYIVKILQGEMPAKGADVSVFIDTAGYPLQPLSYADASRRSYARAAMLALP